NGGLNVSVGGNWVAVGQSAGSSNVKVYNLADLSLAKTIQTRSSAATAGYAGGTRVAWQRNAQGDWELLTASGPGGPALAQYLRRGTGQGRSYELLFGGWIGGAWIA